MTWTVGCTKKNVRWICEPPRVDAAPVWKCAICKRGNVLWVDHGAISMVPECRVCRAKVDLTVSTPPLGSPYSPMRDYW